MLTRDDAIKIAINHAKQSYDTHDYLMNALRKDNFETFVPHEWIIQAILFAANGEP